MLKDPALFDVVEEALRKNGTIAQFEEECGPIKGRMMITVADIPEGIEVSEERGVSPTAFEASFDFYDSTIGLAIYTEDRKLATGLWVTAQKENAEAPSRDWTEFFIKTLVSSIRENGSYSWPIYSFVTDTADLTFIPTAPKEE